MTRNLKALGLALAAVFALAAVGASAASAAEDHFRAAQKTALLTGVSHDNEFKLTPNGVSFKCTTSRFAATIADGATEATVDVEYQGTINVGPPHTTHCTSSAGNVTVHMNGCDYDLTGDTSQEDPKESGKLDAKVWITCPPEKEITLTSSLGPVIHIPAQTPTEGGVTYTNEGGKVKVSATATGITATCTTAFLCGLGGIPTHSNAYDYNGTVLMTGYEDIEGLPTPVEEGKPINIEVEST